MDEEKLMTNGELILRRIHELCEELGRLKPDDPKRKEINDEIKKLADSFKVLDEVEQNKVVSLAKLEIEQDKVNVDAKRNKIERGKMWMGAFLSILYLFGGCGAQFISYILDEVYVKNNSVKKFGDDVVKFGQKLINWKS